MELLHLYYTGQNPKAMLLLYLGERNNKLCGILVDYFTDHEREALKNNNYLEEASLEERIIWVRQHCPAAYRFGYREIKTDNFTIINRHQLC